MGLACLHFPDSPSMGQALSQLIAADELPDGWQCTLYVGEPGDTVWDESCLMLKPMAIVDITVNGHLTTTCAD